MKVKGVGNILFVKDFDKMAGFYEGVMNLNPEVRESGWRTYSTGSATFSLHAIPDYTADTISISDPPIARSDGPLKLIFRVADFSAAKQELLNAGAQLLNPDSQPNNQRLDLLDPEGNVFQITS